MNNENCDIIALEFFSGIGGLHLSLKNAFENSSLKYLNINIKVVKAFEINEHANAVYKKNFPNTIISKKNIEFLVEEDIPISNIWLLSPPCQPFTKGGSKKDLNDPRCKPLLKLIKLMLKTNFKNLPQAWFLENVIDFEKSDTHKLMMDMFKKLNYVTFEFLLSPTLIGIPNTRVRYYCIAINNKKNLDPLNELKSSIYNKYNNYIARNVLLNNRSLDDINKEYSNIICNFPYDLNEYKNLIDNVPLCIGDVIQKFDDEVIHILENLAINIIKNNNSFKFDVVNSNSKASTTFTKSYIDTLGRGGPLLENSNYFDKIEFECNSTKETYIHIFNTCNLYPERFKVIQDYKNIRCFHPMEILSIMGFPKNWFENININFKQQYSLVGNSISISVVTILLKFLLEILLK